MQRDSLSYNKLEKREEIKLPAELSREEIIERYFQHIPEPETVVEQEEYEKRIRAIQEWYRVIPDELKPYFDDIVDIMEGDEESFWKAPPPVRAKIAELAPLPSTEKLREILNYPLPELLVRSMPPQELLYTLKEIGFEDSAEIIEMATREQISYCLELDCWIKDRPNYEKFKEWLNYLIYDEKEAAEKVISAMEPELVVLFFRRLFKIYRLSPEDPDPEIETVGDLIRTPDRYYAVEIPFPPEDRDSDLARAALDLFLSYGFQFYHWLFESILHALTVELEERAYQFHKGKLEDIGFIDYYDAIGMFQPLPPHQSPPPPSNPKNYSHLMPILNPPEGEGLFREAVRKLSPEQRERVFSELLYINNKALAVDQVEFGDRAAAQAVLKEVLYTVEIGMEIATDRGARDGSEILEKHHLEWVFRVGFTALANLRNKARRLSSDERLTLSKREKFSLLESPYREFYMNLLLFKPRFYTGFDPIPGQSARLFRSLDDVNLADEILEQIAKMPVLFFEEFGFNYEKVREELLETDLQSPYSLSDIKYSHLFLTALVNFQLKGEFRPHPLTKEEVFQFLLKVFKPREDGPNQLDEKFQKKVEELLLANPHSLASEKPRLRQFIRDIWKKLLDEASYLPLDQPPEPKFLDLFIVKK